MQRPVVHFEVYIYQHQCWSVKARHTAEHKEKAIAEARKFFSLDDVAGVRVMKEILYPHTEHKKEVTIYKSNKPNVNIPELETGNISHNPMADPSSLNSAWRSGQGGEVYEVAGQSTRTYGVEGDDDGSSGSYGGHSGGGGSPLTLVAKLVFVVVMSICAGAIATGLFSWAMRTMPKFAYAVGRDSIGDFLFLTFILGFLLSAGLLGSLIISKRDFDVSFDSTPSAPRRPAAPPTQAAATSQQNYQPSPQQGAAAHPAATEAQTGDAASQQNSLSADKTDPKIDDMVAAVKKAEKDAEIKQIQEKQKKEKAAENKELGIETSIETVETTAETTILDPLKPLERHLMVIMRFLGIALDAVKKSNPKLDAHGRFGVSLYMAGACEFLGQSKALRTEETRLLVEHICKILGYQPYQAKNFAQTFGKYLSEGPQYMEMYGAGRTALTAFVRNDEAAPTTLVPALEAWAKPKIKQEKSGGDRQPITVMFTDMVGSTSMTSTLGDAGAQEVVRYHNAIVRSCLMQFSGKEVKHTGDGIMASFESASKAVEACIEMQRRAVAHCEENPDRPVVIRIGINTGEPIVEDNDLFGTTVQLAARVCAKADAEEVYVSETVKVMCSGKNLVFESRGLFELKGFKEPLPLYEALWKAEDLIAHDANEKASEDDQNAPEEAASTTDEDNPSPAAASEAEA